MSANAGLVLLALCASIDCATYRLPITADEQCALRGMKLAGFAFGGSASIAESESGSRSESSSRSNTYTCEVPRTTRDRCSVVAFQTSAMAKGRINEDAESYSEREIGKLGAEIKARADHSLEACP